MSLSTFARVSVTAGMLVAFARSPLISTVEAARQDGSPGSGTCLTPAPGATWVCVGDGWVPPDHPLAIGPRLPPPPPPPPPNCVGTSPGIGWLCVNGGWLPPGHPLRSQPPPLLPPPSQCAGAAPVADWICTADGTWRAPEPPPTECPGAAPGVGWVCIDGGWLPADHPLARPVLDGTVVSFVPMRVRYGAPPGLAASQRLVFRDREQWIAQRDGLFGGPPFYGWQEVDFAHEMVIVASAGTQRFGTTITAVSAAMDARGLSVLLTTRIPDASCGYSHASTPVEVLRVPRNEVPVFFKERVERVSCAKYYDLYSAFECPPVRPADDWSCGSDGNWVPSGFAAGGGTQLPVIPLLDSFLEGAPRRLVVRDVVMWKAFWEELHHESNAAWRTLHPESHTRPLPEIDFTTDMLVVAAFGDGGAGSAITVEAASLDPTALTVAVRTDSGGCNRMPTIWAPVSVVRLPRSDAPVVFHERQNLIICRGPFYY